MFYDNDICLRPVKYTDSEILYQAINDPLLVRYNSPYAPVDEINHNEWLASVVKDKSRRLFVIERLDSIVGSIQLFDIDLLHRHAELSIRLFKNNDCSQGVGTTAIQLICEHGFKDLGLIRIWLRVFNSNTRAIRAYEKTGFLIEGTMKKAVFIDGRFQDVIIMAKLQNE